MNATEKSGVRGRRRAFDLDAAVDTAITLFHARGYDAIGVAELVSELGIKPPSFYAAFGSKAGLFERAIRRYSCGPGNVLARALAEGGGVVTVIRRTLELAAEMYPSQGGAAGCLVLDGARNSADPEARAAAEAAKRASRDAVRDLIATESAGHADRLADFVLVTMMGMSAAARDGAGETMLRGVAAIAGRAFEREMAAR